MAPIFGKDLCEQFVGLEILSMGEDEKLKVRTESVKGIPVLGGIVSKELFNSRFLPLYLRFVWVFKCLLFYKAL